MNRVRNSGLHDAKVYSSLEFELPGQIIFNWSQETCSDQLEIQG
jgi:hypothetical protein